MNYISSVYNRVIGFLPRAQETAPKEQPARNALTEFFLSALPNYKIPTASASIEPEEKIEMPLLPIEDGVEALLNTLATQLELDEKDLTVCKQQIQEYASQLKGDASAFYKWACDRIVRARDVITAVNTAVSDAFTETFQLDSTFEEMSGSMTESSLNAQSRYGKQLAADPWRETKHQVQVAKDIAFDWTTFSARVATKMAATGAGFYYGGSSGGMAMAELFGLVDEIPESVKRPLFMAAVAAASRGDANALMSAAVALYGPDIPQAAVWVLHQAWAFAQPYLPEMAQNHADPAKIAEFISRVARNVKGAFGAWTEERIEEFVEIKDQAADAEKLYEQQVEAMRSETRAQRTWKWLSGPVANKLTKAALVGASTKVFNVAGGVMGLFSTQKNGPNYMNAMMSAGVGKVMGAPAGMGFALAANTALGQDAIDVLANSMKTHLKTSSKQLFQNMLDAIAPRKQA